MSDAICKWSKKCFGIQNSLIWKPFLRNCVGALIFRFQGVDQIAVSHCAPTQKDGGNSASFWHYMLLGSAASKIFSEDHEEANTCSAVPVSNTAFCHTYELPNLGNLVRLCRSLLSFAPLLPTTVTMAPFLPWRKVRSHVVG